MTELRQLTPQEVIFVGGETPKIYQHTGGLIMLDGRGRPGFGFGLAVVHRHIPAISREGERDFPPQAFASTGHQHRAALISRLGRGCVSHAAKESAERLGAIGSEKVRSR